MIHPREPAIPGQFRSTRGRVDVDQPRLHPEHGPVWCLYVDGASRVLVWEAVGEGNGRPEGEASVDEWAGWPMVETEGGR